MLEFEPCLGATALAAKGLGHDLQYETVTAQVKAPLAKEVDKRKLVEEAFLFALSLNYAD